MIIILPILGRFHTTRGTPDLLTTFPPAASILASSISHSGLWSRVKGLEVRHDNIINLKETRIMERE